MVAAWPGGQTLSPREVRVAMTLRKQGGLPPRLEWETRAMATAGRAPWADNFFESGMTPSRRDGIRGEGSGALRAFASKLVTLCAISCAMAVAGCVSNSAQREVKADPAAAPAEI